MAFKQYLPSILPAWLQGPNGLAYGGVIGGVQDTISNDVRAAATAGMPTGDIPDALNAIAFERQLLRGTAQSTAQFAEALRLAWDAWTWAGTPLGMLLQLEVLYPGIPIVIVQQAAHAFTLNPNTTLPVDQRLVITTLPNGGWYFDDNGGLPLSEGIWNRAGVIFPGPLPATWTDVESPPTGATAPTAGEVNQIIYTVNKWRPAKALMQWIRVVVSGRIYGWPPTQLWGDAGLTWGGGNVVQWNCTPY